MALYRTTFTLTVLSDRPLPECIDLDHIAREGDDGAYVIDLTEERCTPLTPDGMRSALFAAGSDGSFFDDAESIDPEVT